ncbi:MAG: Ig-like domain-containing protein, partial [Anaerolineales bacterium]|nr:Ig-like domain-containing protein [Anaerolineales bacterium]
MIEKPKQTFGRNCSLWIIGTLLVIVCAGGIMLLAKRLRSGASTGNGTSVTVNVTQPSSAGAAAQDDKYKIGVELSDGQSQPETASAIPPAAGEPLSPEETALLLSRLPALPLDSGRQTEFNFPPEVLPPPRSGNKIEESFPPAEAESNLGVVVNAGPLQVARFAPEGEIPIAPFVSVTFNQPMVPLGTLSDLAALDVPVKIEPPLQGTWRWLGTKTLTFEYDSALIDRLPKATEYRVTVPAGVKSAAGEVLAEAVSWTFKTPPPKIVAMHPSDSPQPLEPIFFILFDQRIEPAAVLKTIDVRAGNQPVNIVLAEQSEIDKDDGASQLAKNAPEGRWLAFRASQPLHVETNVSITVGPETPSAEGPLKTTE